MISPDTRSPLPQCRPATVDAALLLVLLFGQPAASACPPPTTLALGEAWRGTCGDTTHVKPGARMLRPLTPQASHFGRVEFTSAKARDFPGVFFSSILTSEYPPLQEVVTRQTSGGSMKSWQGALAGRSRHTLSH